MKTISFFSTSLTCLFLSLDLAASEGATVVGDGGLVVDCGEEMTLLDLFEKDVLLGSKQITLSRKEAASNREMVEEGINRLKNRFHLSDDELKRAKRAAHEFNRMPLFDPWRLHIGKSYHYYFSELPKVTVDKRVYDEIIKKKCILKTVVIRPSRDPLVVDVHKEICSRSLSSFENCFYVNTTIFKKMSKEQRACLIIHEIARYLPSNIRPSDERVLREVVADVCTEQ